MSGNQKQNVLLHGCCGPCITHPYQLLKKTYNVAVYFYNPNIHPKSEYDKRLHAVKDLADRWEFRLLVGQYDEEEWSAAIRGFENEPEGGKRCPVCYRLRMEATAKVASIHRMDIFGTTLTVSPHKKTDVVHEIGRACEHLYGVRYLEMDFKKEEGFKTSCLLSHQEGLYRQHFCGCLYSWPSSRSGEKND